MSALDRLVAAFVAPAREDPEVASFSVPEPPAPPSLALLAPPDAAFAVGSALALGLARGTVVVAVWGVGGAAGLAAPGGRRTRRLAARLADRGHRASPSGRLVRVVLDRPDEAIRVQAAADVPAVLVVAGPRDEQVDRVLRDHDRVLVAGDDLVAHLAAESVAALGVRAETPALPDAPAARALATAGVALVAPWRAPVTEALA